MTSGIIQQTVRNDRKADTKMKCYKIMIIAVLTHAGKMYTRLGLVN